MNRIDFGALVCAALGLLAGTVVNAQAQPAVVPGLLTSVTELAALLADPAVVVIHAERDSSAHAGPQIPRARFLPLRAYVVERNGASSELPTVAHLDSVMESVGISTRSRIVIYGEPLAAARLFFTLDYLGLGAQVSLLDGGLPAWRAASQPVAVPDTTPVSGVLEPRPRPELVIETEELASRLREPNLSLFDARPEAEYRGDVPGDGIQRPGHIPGAHSIFWRRALTAGTPGFMKRPEDLRALIAASPIAAGAQVVTYCKTGVQASYLYFVFRYLGYEPRLYDGSYAEWSRGTERQVER